MKILIAVVVLLLAGCAPKPMPVSRTELPYGMGTFWSTLRKELMKDAHRMPVKSHSQPPGRVGGC